MEYKNDCYESGKMTAKVGIDYLRALKRRHYIYQTVYQDDTGMISEEKAKTYVSAVDGEIEYLMKTKKGKEEFKKIKNFII